MMKALMKIVTLTVAALCLVATSLIGAEPARPVAEPKPGAAPRSFRNVDVEEFDKLRADKQKPILDVRTPKEFAAGHIAGATNIDINDPEFEQKVAALDKSKTYLVHCAAGGRSAKACEKLTQLHFANLYNLKGGLKAWEKAGKPVEK
jgi:rhodanese-related sulfurtransferase